MLLETQSMKAELETLIKEYGLRKITIESKVDWDRMDVEIAPYLGKGIVFKKEIRKCLQWMLDKTKQRRVLNARITNWLEIALRIQKDQIRRRQNPETYYPGEIGMHQQRKIDISAYDS
jgi:hypothetical protein